MELERPEAERADRREFLRRAGIGGVVAGAAWAAPAVLSLDAAHALGTCGVGTSTFNWSSGGNNVRYTSGKVGATTSANIDIRITGTTVSGVFNSGILGHNWMTRSASTGQVDCGGGNTDYRMGNQTSFYTLQMHSLNPGSCSGTGTTNRSVSVTFGFFDAGTTTPHAVRALQFSILDIDGISGSYRDRVEVFINGSGTVASTGPGGVFTVSPITSANSYTQPNTAQARFDADTNQSVLPTGTEGNVTLTSNATTDITTVTVRFQDIRGAAPGTIQWIGLGDLTFCKV